MVSNLSHSLYGSTATPSKEQATSPGDSLLSGSPAMKTCRSTVHPAECRPSTEYRTMQVEQHFDQCVDLERMENKILVLGPAFKRAPYI